ncbi:YbaY family lipoprotein [Arhodomonas sp. AD133]|uniref:YbaY family lipoprotein n=1 Tax=Arhodomonas sp. AD133 TaxID=3415009 RepID=UPI003EBC5659
MMRTLLVSLSLVLIVGACATPPRDAADSGPAVTGEVLYRERIMLPPEAVLAVHLLDAPGADAPAEVLATQTIDIGDTAPPYSFRLPYDPQSIDGDRRYTIQARIQYNDTLLMLNTEDYPVLTQGNPTNVEVLVRRP